MSRDFLPPHLSDAFLRLSWRRSAYRTVFNSPEGRRVLSDLAAFCGAGRPVAVPGDATQTYYNDGMRRVYLRIKAILDMTDEEMIALSGQSKETPHVQDY